tara:strand:- start:1243 stop:3639 length:2397 start_codon:yes stop_codon:yes gene_type:complete
MGANLNRLMKQYGVSTASKAPYLGTTEKDREAYDTYSKEYDRRMLGTPAYAQTQFDTSRPPMRTKDKKIGGILDPLPDWIKPPPPGAIVTQAFEFITNPVTGEVHQVPTGGYSINEDAFTNMELTGNYYDDILANPIYETVVEDTIDGGSGNDTITLPVIPPGIDLSGLNNPITGNLSNIPGLTVGAGYKWDENGNIIFDSSAVTSPVVRDLPNADDMTFSDENVDLTQTYGLYNTGGRAIPNITVTAPRENYPSFNTYSMNMPMYTNAEQSANARLFGDPSGLEVLRSVTDDRQFQDHLDYLAENIEDIPMEINVEDIEIKASDLAPTDVYYQGQTFDEMKNALYGGAKKFYDASGKVARDIGNIPVLGPLGKNMIAANLGLADAILLGQIRGAVPPIDSVLKNYGFNEGGNVDIDVIEDSTDIEVLSENVQPNARSSRYEELRSMLEKPTSSYDAQITDLTSQLGDQQTQFMSMIESMANNQSTGPSDAEKYFRLAAAFGTPTQSGHFMENLALAGKELGDIKKETREATQKGDALRLQGLQYGMDMLKDRLENVQTLSTYEKETFKDYQKMIFEAEEEYFKVQDEREYDLKVLQDEREYDATKPKSEAAKIASDMGLTRGSEEYNIFIKEYYDKQNLIRDLEIQQLERQATTLSNPEISALEKNDLKLQAADKAIIDLERALELNKDAYTGNFYDQKIKFVKGLIDSDDPRYRATEELENLLAKAGLTQLKATFGGNISDGERQAILKIQGIESKGVAARKQILENALKAMRSVLKKAETKRDEIRSGEYTRRTN